RMDSVIFSTFDMRRTDTSGMAATVTAAPIPRQTASYRRVRERDFVPFGRFPTALHVAPGCNSCFRGACCFGHTSSERSPPNSRRFGGSPRCELRGGGPGHGKTPSPPFARRRALLGCPTFDDDTGAP